MANFTPLPQLTVEPFNSKLSAGGPGLPRQIRVKKSLTPRCPTWQSQFSLNIFAILAQIVSTYGLTTRTRASCHPAAFA